MEIAPLTYTVDQAAQRLGGPFTVDWLKNHLSEIPHIKTGNGRGRSGRIAFSESHLVQIIDRYTVEPVEVDAQIEFPSMASRRGRRRPPSSTSPL